MQVILTEAYSNAEQVDDKGQQNNGNEDKHHRGKVVGLAPLIF